MALKPTIFKFAIALSDVDNNRYLDLSLTVAQHPSETLERMMVRLLAYCLNAEDGLEFTRGLSENDEPDLWQHSLDGRILKWIEVGEPAAELDTTFGFDHHLRVENRTRQLFGE